MSDVRPPDPRGPDEHWQDEQLAAYLLRELPEEEMEAMDAHVRTCARCRDALARMDEALVGSVDGLPEPPPLSTDVWAGIQARVATSSPRSSATRSDRGPEHRSAPRRDPGRRVPPPPRPAARFGRGAWLAAVALIVAVGSWGAWQRQQVQQVRVEADALRARVEVLEGVVGTVQARADALGDDRARIARWLATPDVRTARLAGGDGGPSVGSVLFEPSGRALVVMRDPPQDGSDFQAWGVRDGQVTSLGAFDGLTLEVDAGAYEAVAVSLEPDGGSPAPTDVLGSAGRS